MGRVPVREGLFILDGDAIRLIGGFSPASGRYHFPRAPVCPYTGAEDVEEVELSDRGALWSWTSVAVAPLGYDGPVPYGFGAVELTEGLRVIGRLTETDPDLLHEGQPMRVVAEPLGTDQAGDEVVTWAFAPEEDAGG